MLAARGIVSDEDRVALLAGLDAVERELAEDRFPFAPDDEDIHMAIERRLTELAGPVGGKLHTARSRRTIRWSPISPCTPGIAPARRWRRSTC